MYTGPDSVDRDNKWMIEQSTSNDIKVKTALPAVHWWWQN